MFIVSSRVCSRLVQRWVDYMLGALLAAARPDTREKITPLMDSITCQLLALSESVVCESCCVMTLFFTHLSFYSVSSLHNSLLFPLTAFSREHSIRLENAAVLKALFQSRLLSDSVIMK